MALLGNPRLSGMAQGLLAASGPSTTPVSFGQAWGMGLQSRQQQQELQRRQQMEALRMQALQQQMAQAKQQQEAQARLAEGFQSGNFADPASRAQFAGLLANAGQVGAAVDFMQGPDPSEFERKLMLAGIDPRTPEGQAMVRQYLLKPQTQVNVGMDKPLSVTDIQKLRDQQGNMPPIGTTPAEARGKYSVVDPRTPEQAGKEQMLETARAQLPIVENLLFDKDGNVQRANVFNARVGVPGTEGQTLGTALEAGIQAITRSETGAAMPPQEVENARKRFQPGPLDTDKTIRLKWKMYQDFLNGSLKLINPRGGFDGKKFDRELNNRLKSDDADPLGIR